MLPRFQTALGERNVEGIYISPYELLSQETLLHDWISNPPKHNTCMHFPQRALINRLCLCLCLCQR